MAGEMPPGATCQLWLDVPAHAHPRPRRTRAPRKPAGDDPIAGQMELHMAPPAPPAPVVRRAQPKSIAASPPAMAGEPSLSFAAWLVAQAKRPGTLGELAKAVKLDRLFPKAGNVDQVRARFGAAGADGDAYEALDDAEREFARL